MRVNDYNTGQTSHHPIKYQENVPSVPGSPRFPGYWAKVTPGYLEVMISKNGDNTYVSYTYHILSVTSIPEKKQ